MKLVLKLSLQELEVPQHILQMTKDEFELSCEDAEFEEMYNQEIQIIDRYGLLGWYNKQGTEFGQQVSFIGTD